MSKISNPKIELEKGMNFNDKDFTNRPHHYGPVPVRSFYGLKRED